MALIKCISGNGGGADFSALFPLTLRLSDSITDGTVVNGTSGSGYVIPLSGINHITISGYGSWSFSNGISMGNNIDVSALDYITASCSVGQHNQSANSYATITIVD